ncbi:hypothetical protein MPTK2_7g01370 [Marchantia polymorpha subsp. ruderalis]
MVNRVKLAMTLSPICMYRGSVRFNPGYHLPMCSEAIQEVSCGSKNREQTLDNRRSLLVRFPKLVMPMSSLCELVWGRVCPRIRRGSSNNHEFGVVGLRQILDLERGVRELLTFTEEKDGDKGEVTIARRPIFVYDMNRRNGDSSFERD